MQDYSDSVWILLLNWQNPIDTIECLESIDKVQDKEIAGIVLCDNGSTDHSMTHFLDWLKANQRAYTYSRWQNSQFNEVESVSADETSGLPIHLIDTGSNLGFAGGNNVGLNYIQQSLPYQYIYLLNNDTLIKTGTVSSLVNEFIENPKVGLCGSKVIYEHTRDKVQAYSGAKFNFWIGRAVNLGAMAETSADEDAIKVREELDYIMGASMMISKECLDLTGVMEAGYFLYYEEIDWAVRAKRKGFALGYAPKSIVFHKEGATIGSSYEKQGRSPLSSYYLVASKIRFTMKFYPWFLPTVVAFSFFQAVRAFASGDFKTAKTILGAVFLRPFQK